MCVCVCVCVCVLEEIRKNKMIQNLMNLFWKSTLNVSVIITFFRTSNS